MQTGPDPDLPRAIALAWGVAANPQRGPKRELSIERIVDVAIELADEGGLAAVSMSAVAAQLGFTPMSLYRYVTAKDDIIMLMQESAIGVPPETIREADSWRAGLRACAREQVAVYRRHPWILDAPMVGAMSTPNNAAWVDAGLHALAPTALDEHEKVAVTLALLAQTRLQGLVERSYAEQAAQRGTSVDDVDLDVAEMMATLISPEEFPHLRAALDAGVFAPGGGDPFAFGIERVLDGVERYLENRPSSGGLPPFEFVDPPEALADKHVREAAKARREAEKALRDARKREREALKNARAKAPSRGETAK